jgi:DNA-binding response OmpR family regulator
MRTAARFYWCKFKSMVKGKYVHVVEDDELVRDAIADALMQAGANVASSGSAEEFLMQLKDQVPDLVLADLRLPEKDGLELLAQLRASENFPVIIITGKGDEFDEVTALEIGADGFIRKPVPPRVLVAHVRSVLRRYESMAVSEFTRLAAFLAERGWRVDDRTRELLRPDGDSTPLTATELRLLAVLAERSGEIVDRGDLYQHVFNREMDDQSRSIDVLLSRLRRKLHAVGPDGHYLSVQSEYGKGYSLTWVRNSDGG